MSTKLYCLFYLRPSSFREPTEGRLDSSTAPGRPARQGTHVFWWLLHWRGRWAWWRGPRAEGAGGEGGSGRTSGLRLNHPTPSHSSVIRLRLSEHLPRGSCRARTRREEPAGSRRKLRDCNSCEKKKRTTGKWRSVVSTSSAWTPAAIDCEADGEPITNRELIRGAGTDARSSSWPARPPEVRRLRSEYPSRS